MWSMIPNHRFHRHQHPILQKLRVLLQQQIRTCTQQQYRLLWLHRRLQHPTTLRSVHFLHQLPTPVTTLRFLQSVLRATLLLGVHWMSFMKQNSVPPLEYIKFSHQRNFHLVHYQINIQLYNKLNSFYIW
jgi:hypothetical protein